MAELYEEDLAFIQAEAFGDLAYAAAPLLVERFRSAGVQRVVDAGSGAGVTTRAFIEAGFDVVAIDQSPALSAIARVAAPGATFVVGSIHEVDLPDCDAIAAVGEPLTYYAPDADGDALLRRFFQNAARALPAGGLMLFDVIVVGEPLLDARGWKSSDDWAILSETREDRGARRLVRSIETFRRIGRDYRRSREQHHVQLFDERAVVEWLQGAGFEVETSRGYGSVELLPRRVAFFARKTG